jgi:hypothetical protein
MTKLLEKAISRLQQLPEDRQDELAERSSMTSWIISFLVTNVPPRRYSASSKRRASG